MDSIRIKYDAIANSNLSNDQLITAMTEQTPSTGEWGGDETREGGRETEDEAKKGHYKNTK